jgi:hypothetical protein
LFNHTFGWHYRGGRTGTGRGTRAEKNTGLLTSTSPGCPYFEHWMAVRQNIMLQRHIYFCSVSEIA